MATPIQALGQLIAAGVPVRNLFDALHIGSIVKAVYPDGVTDEAHQAAVDAADAIVNMWPSAEYEENEVRRDMFAAAALQGLLAKTEHYESNAAYAEFATAIAYAMMLAGESE